MRYLGLVFINVALGLLPSVTFSQTQKVDIELARRHLELGEQHSARNDPRAEQEFLKAIELRSGKYPAAWRELAFFYRRALRLHESAEAMASFLRQTKSRDSDDLALYKEIRRDAELQSRIDGNECPDLSDMLKFIPIAMGYGLQKAAYKYAYRAVSLYPSSAEAHILLVRYLPRDQESNRLGFIQTALLLGPNEPEAYVQLGKYHFARRDPASAVEAYQKALSVSGGEYCEAWQWLGEALPFIGRIPEAIAAYRNFLASCPHDIQYRRMIESRVADLQQKERLSLDRSQKAP